MEQKEQAEQNNSRRCANCEHFLRFYTLSDKQFRKTDCGLCSQKHGYVRTDECCEKFGYHTYIPSMKVGLSMQLRKIMTDLSAVRNLMEETIHVYDENL